MMIEHSRHREKRWARAARPSGIGDLPGRETPPSCPTQIQPGQACVTQTTVIRPGRTVSNRRARCRDQESYSYR